MSQIQRIILYILLLIAGAAWTLIARDRTGTSSSTGIAAPQVGFAAPDFSLQTTEGETYTLSALRGQAVLINVWATWCPPCRAEMPVIEKLSQEYKDKGLVVLAVNSTFQDDPAAIRPFAEKYKLSFPILLDEKGNVTRSYQVNALPSSFFIDRQGVIREVVIGGPMSEALLRTRIENIIQ
jgi:cytochrome c biogenesis protein CcmG/thiol:disulfide interchange protein DsbE